MGFWFVLMLEIELKAFWVLSTCCTTGLHPGTHVLIFTWSEIVLICNAHDLYRSMVSTPVFSPCVVSVVDSASMVTPSSSHHWHVLISFFLRFHLRIKILFEDSSIPSLLGVMFPLSTSESYIFLTLLLCTLSLFHWSVCLFSCQ